MTLRNKRLRLMHGGAWKGHIRNISGNPITLDNALGLQTLEILGNSVQNGTPSPDNPVEVVGVGERTLNLFNAALHPKIVRGGYLTNTAALVGTPLKIPVDAGKTYTIYRKNASATNRDFYFRAIRFEDNNGLVIRVDTKAKPNNTIFYGTYDNNYFAAAKFTVPDGAAILRVGCLPNTADALQKLCDEIMLVEGSYTAATLPAFEPYGYKIPVNAEGESVELQTLNIYTPQILHGLGDVSDIIKIDFDNRKAQLIKRYEYFKVNEKSWSRSTGNIYDTEISTNRFHTYTNLYSGSIKIYDSYCNILQKYIGSLWDRETEGFTWNESQLHLRINNDKLSITINDSIEERTTKFTQYIQNNDIYVLGKLVTPVTTDISNLQDWDNMPNISGTIILTANSTAEPTLNVTYYSTAKE